MALLTANEIKSASGRVPEWRRRGKAIHRTFEFKDFVAAMKFVNKIARIAEKAWHHPDIDIRWNKVKLVLSTHSEGGLTEKDFAVAEKIDQIANA
ncbi:MAG TPA: 4a-hydroxytetrahydrobiopterin dehydratase [Verrucomicrobiales bacterium]|nr:4a-hydroxytetrahydrobiopterin dehydratase [Verrucomicrobiales bacterium]